MVRALKAKPGAVFAADLAAMTTLPPAPPAVGERFTIRLGRDYYVRAAGNDSRRGRELPDETHYVRAAGNDYSVDPAMIDRLATVSVSLGQVLVTYQGQTMACHQRVWASGHTVTDPTRVAAAARLRHDFQHPPARVLDDALIRDLAVYDQAFGLAAADFEGQVA